MHTLSFSAPYIGIHPWGLELSQKTIVAASLALATLVAVTDYCTGDEIPLIICYLPTIAVMCWVSHITVAVSLAMVCCTGWLVDDLILLDKSNLALAHIWTALTHMLFYVVIISLLARLRFAHDREQMLARTDSLTGLMNRKAFREAARSEIERMRRTAMPLSVAYLDCDNFKAINDTRSHAEGDWVLQTIGTTMRRSLRFLDSVARLGGDEFAILLQGAGAEGAKIAMERLQHELDAAMESHGWPVTFSIGVVVFERAPYSVDELLMTSDTLMFQVKRHKQAGGIAFQVEQTS